jgi:hypothetical protein
MPARKTPTKLTQREVQESIAVLLRIATVWARRSFEEDEPRDRPHDERLLRKVIALVSAHRDVPLVNASGKTRTLLRESSLHEFELFQSVHDAIRAAKNASDEENRIAARLRLAFRRAGGACTSSDARRYAANLSIDRTPTELAGRVLQMAGMRGYRSASAVEGSVARAREVAARRETSRRELIEYFLACLQIPEEDLHGAALALDSIITGGTLKAYPRRWTRRSASWGLRPPGRRPYYDRYGQPRLDDRTRAELASANLWADVDDPGDAETE